MKKIENIIEEINGFLKTKYQDFRGIYFFGSRARGNFKSESDYDLVFVFDRKIDWRFENEITREIFPFLIKYDIVIDPHIYQISDIENPKTPFRMNVKKDGYFYAI